ncbi:hypothetical protein CR513_44461, partial [Mucuna pruriens]
MVAIKKLRSNNGKDYFNQTKPKHYCFKNNVPKSFLGEAVLIATYLINRLSSRILEFKSLMDVLSSFYSNLSISSKLPPKVFGCVSFVHVHGQDMDKLDPRALKCVFVKYFYTQKVYKCFHPLPKKFCLRMLPFTRNKIISLNLIFREPEKETLAHNESDNDTPTRLENNTRFGKNLVYTRRSKVISELTHALEANPTPSDQNMMMAFTFQLPLEKELENELKNLSILSNYLSFNKFSLAHKTFFANLNFISIPTIVFEGLFEKNWKQAIDIEMEALEKNKTWKLVSLPAGKKPVGCKWVYTVKYKVDGLIERYKARLVAKDYFETFAAVAKMNTIWVILPLAAKYGRKLQQFDVKNFAWGV